jgi:hypothetical protein
MRISSCLVLLLALAGCATNGPREADLKAADARMAAADEARCWSVS